MIATFAQLLAAACTAIDILSPIIPHQTMTFIIAASLTPTGG